MATLKDIEADPKSVFNTPEAVLVAHELADDEKYRILKAWERDARDLAEAETENMAGGEPNMLDRVLRALDTLDYPTAEKSG